MQLWYLQGNVVLMGQQDCKPVCLLWRYMTRLGASSHMQLDCLLKSLLRVTANTLWKVHITSPLCERNLFRDSPHKWPVMEQVLPCQDIIMDGCVYSWLDCCASFIPNTFPTREYLISCFIATDHPWIISNPIANISLHGYPLSLTVDPYIRVVYIDCVLYQIYE